MTGDGAGTELLGGDVGGRGYVEGFLVRIRSALDVLLFRAEAVDDLAADEAASLSAVGIVTLAGVAAGAGFGLMLPLYVAYAGYYLAGSLLFAGAIHLGAAVLLGGRGSFVALYRPLGHTYLALWVIGIPVIAAFFAWALWLWQLAASVLIVERVYRIDRVKAVVAVAVPALMILVVALLANGFFAVAALLGAWLS